MPPRGAKRSLARLFAIASAIVNMQPGVREDDSGLAAGQPLQ
jgi:hypothetical protein